MIIHSSITEDHSFYYCIFLCLEHFSGLEHLHFLAGEVEGVHQSEHCTHSHPFGVLHEMALTSRVPEDARQSRSNAYTFCCISYQSYTEFMVAVLVVGVGVEVEIGQNGVDFGWIALLR